tara:strand:+ start:11673 stop:12500 length:828 start_codon:yes stop_codon:yes gene_type:complete
MQNDPTKPIWVNKTPQPLKLEQAKKPYRIFVATPVHSEVSLHYTQALLEFQTYCHFRGIEVMFQLVKSSLVTQGRNLCVDYFMTAGHTHLLFIDSDIDFNAKDIQTMVELDKDVISIPYPLKTMNWEKAFNDVKSGKVKDAKGLSLATNLYPLKMDDENNIKIEPDGTIEVSHSPTGCMLIKRSVIEKMIAAWPDMKIEQDTVINGKMVKKEFFYNFFDTEFDAKNHTYLGEDFAFCKRWRSLGGKCHAYIDATIAHIGEHQYIGKFGDELIRTS